MIPKCAPFLLCLLCFLPEAARAGFWDDAWLDPALLQAQDVSGGTGFIHVPAPQSLPDGMDAAAIHNYQVQVGRGFKYGFEAGGTVQLDGLDPKTQSEIDGWKYTIAGKENLLYGRWSPLVQGPGCPIGLSVGVEGLGIQNLDPKQTPLASLDGLERQYVVAGGILPDLPMFYVAAGYGGGSQKSAGFGVLAFAPFPGIVAMAEYNNGVTDLGVRALLSTQIKLDLAVSGAQSLYRIFDLVPSNHVIIGVTYCGSWL
jgi:hypothetical protein